MVIGTSIDRAEQKIDERSYFWQVLLRERAGARKRSIMWKPRRLVFGVTINESTCSSAREIIVPARTPIVVAHLPDIIVVFLLRFCCE